MYKCFNKQTVAADARSAAMEAENHFKYSAMEVWETDYFSKHWKSNLKGLWIIRRFVKE